VHGTATVPLGFRRQLEVIEIEVGICPLAEPAHMKRVDRQRFPAPFGFVTLSPVIGMSAAKL
jgi:hypothetical protein